MIHGCKNIVIFQTEGDGNCLFRAILNSCDFVDPSEGKKYGYHQLRLQAVNHMVMQRDLLFDEVKEDIRMTYGALEDVEGELRAGGGGLSYKSYCQYMMGNGVWGDIIILKVIASMWACKLCVIHADTFNRTNFRFEGALTGADITLVFNCNYLRGHYIGCVRTDGTNFVIATPQKDADYVRVIDRVERCKRSDYNWEEGEEDRLISIPENLYKMLCYKAEQFDKMADLAKKPTPDLQNEPEPPLPSLPDPDNIPTPSKRGKGSSGSKRRRKDDDDDDDDDDDERDPADPTTRKQKGGKYQGEEKISEEELGHDVTVCPRCKTDQKTHSRLLSHVQKFHEDVFNFLCKECDRGFITKLGWRSHMKSHMQGAKRVKCKKCKKDFIDKKSLKGHMRKIHPVGGLKDLPCPFDECEKIFHNKTNLEQHKKACKKNPDRKELKCHICGKGGFWNQIKLQEHKRDIHRWR